MRELKVSKSIQKDLIDNCRQLIHLFVFSPCGSSALLWCQRAMAQCISRAGVASIQLTSASSSRSTLCVRPGRQPRSSVAVMSVFDHQLGGQSLTLHGTWSPRAPAHCTATPPPPQPAVSFQPPSALLLHSRNVVNIVESDKQMLGTGVNTITQPTRLLYEFLYFLSTFPFSCQKLCQNSANSAFCVIRAATFGF